MATIPVYDGQQVRQAPLQGGFQETAKSDAAFGGIEARQLGEAANAATRVSVLLERKQQREDADAVFRAETNLRSEYLKFETEVKKGRQGRSAEGVVDDTDKWWADAEKNFNGTLTNDRQRAALAKSASRLRLQSSAQMAQFQDGQLERSHDESWAASKGVIISDTATNPTPINIANAVEQIKEKNTYQGGRKGWDADQLKVQNIKDMTILHSSVIQQLADKNPAAAEKYFQSVPNDEFDGTRRDAIKDGIENARIRFEAKAKAAVSANENAAEKRVWASIRDGKEPNQADLKMMNPEKAVKEVGGYFKQLAKAEAVNGRLHAKEDNYEALDMAEKAIQQGDIQTERDLDRYAPFLRPDTFRTLRKSFDKRGDISEKEMERVYSERMGETRTKWIKDETKAQQWIAFKKYVQDDVREKKRPEDIDALADRWFMKGYGKEDSVFTNDPNTYGEARAKGRKDFVIKTPDASKADVDSALAILRKTNAATPTGKSAADDFYTNHYLDASRWFGARNEPITGARAAAYAILKQNNKPVTPANINAVIQQLKGSPSDGPQQPSR
jgi:hypothetical protein